MQVRGWSILAVVVALGFATGCSDNEAPAPPTTPAAAGPLAPSEPFGLTTVTLRAPDDRAVVVPVYDAYNDRTRTRGLMGREELPRGTGMVFRFKENRTSGFWMKNTLIPLSIAFFDSNGSVVAVRDMEPCEADPCPSYRPGAPYRGALELEQAFAAEVGVERGWQVELPAGLPPAQ